MKYSVVHESHVVLTSNNIMLTMIVLYMLVHCSVWTIITYNDLISTIIRDSKDVTTLQQPLFMPNTLEITMPVSC